MDKTINALEIAVNSKLNEYTDKLMNRKELVEQLSLNTLTDAIDVYRNSALDLSDEDQVAWMCWHFYGIDQFTRSK